MHTNAMNGKPIPWSYNYFPHELLHSRVAKCGSSPRSCFALLHGGPPRPGTPAAPSHAGDLSMHYKCELQAMAWWSCFSARTTPCWCQPHRRSSLQPSCPCPWGCPDVHNLFGHGWWLKGSAPARIPQGLLIHNLIVAREAHSSVLFQRPPICEEKVMSAGCQEEDNDFHPGPCNKLHGCMKSLDHGSVQIPQVKRQVQTAIGSASVPEGGGERILLPPHPVQKTKDCD